MNMMTNTNTTTSSTLILSLTTNTAPGHHPNPNPEPAGAAGAGTARRAHPHARVARECQGGMWNPVSIQKVMMDAMGWTAVTAITVKVKVC